MRIRHLVSAPSVPSSAGGTGQLRHWVVVLVASLAVLAATCSKEPNPAANTTPTPAPTGCAPARPHEPGSFPETLSSAALEREYILHVPASYKGDDAAPLVVNLHGFGSNDAEQAIYSGLPAKADEEGFIVVTPKGTGGEPHWNFAGIEPGAPDDVAFIDDLLDTLDSELCIDPSRVYATGISNGAAMSVRLACDLSERVAAIAPVAGLYFPRGCPSMGPVPLIAFHGTDDKLVPFEGGQIRSGLGLRVRPIEESVEDWAEHNGCTSGPQDERVSNHVRLRRYEGCDEGATVELYAVEGGGHTWPGAAIDIPFGLTTREISATDLMWAFFEAHPQP